MNIRLPFKRRITDESSDVPVQLSSRIRNGSLRQRHYQDYAPLFGYAGNIDKFLESLFQGEIDLGNGNVCDNMIDNMAEQAIADMELQRVAHQDGISTMANQRIADRHAYEMQFEKKKDELAELQERLGEINIRFRKSKFRKEFENA